MTEQYYFYDDNTKIVYHGENLPDSWGDLIYLGTSDNPKPAMAAAVFLSTGQVQEGFRLRTLTV